MNGKSRMLRVLSIVTILIGLCAFAGQPVAAKGHGGATFVVAPTGGEDTANLQAAFDQAVAAGPGSKVKLTSGTFSIGLIEVEGFQGSFVGAGRGKTVITTVPDMPCPSDWPVLINFLGGDIPGADVHVADMSFEITDPSPCQPWINPVDPVPAPREDLAVILRVGGSPADDWDNPDTTYASSSFENVDFHGPPLDPANPSYFGVVSGLFLGGPSDTRLGGLGRTKPMEGVHTVASCSFRNNWQAIVTLGLSKSTLTIGGNGSKGNRFAHVYLGLRSFDHDDSSIEFSYNEVTDVAPTGVGVLAQQSNRPVAFGYPWPALSRYLISHNTLRVAGPVDAVAIVDLSSLFGPGKRLDAVVSHNQFHLQSEVDIWGGIVGLGVQEALVANNKFSGLAAAGVYLGVHGIPTGGWTILGNNVEQLEARIAPIWLGMASHNCTVVGGDAQTNVWNMGTGNILTGVNNMQGNPPGPEIQEAMKKKIEILDLFK